MTELDPDQEAALRRLRAAFGFVEILKVVDHEADQDRDDNEADKEEASPGRRAHWRVGRFMPGPTGDPRA